MKFFHGWTVTAVVGTMRETKLPALARPVIVGRVVLVVSTVELRVGALTTELC